MLLPLPLLVLVLVLVLMLVLSPRLNGLICSDSPFAKGAAIVGAGAKVGAAAAQVANIIHIIT